MKQFPPLPDAGKPVGLPPRAARRPDWPRLMNEADAAAYLSIGTTKLRESGPAPKRWDGRTLWDRHDLDRFADALGGQPLDEGDTAAQSKDVERSFLERRTKRKGQGNG